MTWTRRDFIKAAGVAAGAFVLDLSVPLPSVEGSEDHVLPEEETIHTAFIGLGDYGHGLGGLLTRNWKGYNPISIHRLSGAKPESPTDLLRGKELIFLACDQLNEAWSMARKCALKAEPFLLITLEPFQQTASSPLRENETILHAPLGKAFPNQWDPVSSIFGSLVNPGLIGVDIADLKEIVGGKHSCVRPIVLNERFTASPERLFNISGRGLAHSAFIVIEHDLSEISVHQIGELLELFDSFFSERYFAVPFEPRQEGMIITVCRA
jgi:hypothetical protein